MTNARFSLRRFGTSLQWLLPALIAIEVGVLYHQIGPKALVATIFIAAAALLVRTLFSDFGPRASRRTNWAFARHGVALNMLIVLLVLIII